jgi:uncharacterized membrane protein YeaQ/YmgE (transglycosylase-associated protein family)
MTYAMAIQWTSWLIAGSVAAWLANEVGSRGPLGLAVDWIAGVTGAQLAVFLTPVVGWLLALAFSSSPQPFDWRRSIETLSWWYAVPIAFAGGLLFTAIFRRLSRVRTRTSP